jgi:hypothetical protein
MRAPFVVRLKRACNRDIERVTKINEFGKSHVYSMAFNEQLYSMYNDRFAKWKRNSDRLERIVRKFQALPAWKRLLASL